MRFCWMDTGMFLSLKLLILAIYLKLFQSSAVCSTVLQILLRKKTDRLIMSQRFSFIHNTDIMWVKVLLFVSCEMKRFYTNWPLSKWKLLPFLLLRYSQHHWTTFIMKNTWKVIWFKNIWRLQCYMKGLLSTMIF